MFKWKLDLRLWKSKGSMTSWALGILDQQPDMHSIRHARINDFINVTSL